MVAPTYTPPAPAVPNLAEAKSHLVDLEEAIRRAKGARTRAQMDDALRSVDTFLDQVKAALPTSA